MSTPLNQRKRVIAWKMVQGDVVHPDNIVFAIQLTIDPKEQFPLTMALDMDETGGIIHFIKTEINRAPKDVYDVPWYHDLVISIKLAEEIREAAERRRQFCFLSPTQQHAVELIRGLLKNLEEEGIEPQNPTLKQAAQEFIKPYVPDA